MTNVKIALSTVGGLSNTSKMPCKSYGLPAAECSTGGKLRKVEGSTCSDCYACKGAYRWPKVEAAYYRRFDSLGSPDWIGSMSFLINREKSGFFRWHDSGDIQSIKHLTAIIRVCEATPNIRHWLPTREKGILSRFKGLIPDNLTIRLSAPMIDQAAPDIGYLTSSVHDIAAPIGTECDAYRRGGSCGDCRACWDPSIDNISYPKH